MQSTDLTLKIVRTFSATPEQLYRAWTDESLLRQWAAPDDCDVVNYQADAEVGGRWQCTFAIGPNEFHSESGEFLELVPGERIVQTLLFPVDNDPSGGIATVITIGFKEIEPGLTEMTFVQAGGFSSALKEGMNVGWSSCFDKLATLVG